jgi:mannan endo-1,4-beta-mannosidase
MGFNALLKGAVHTYHLQRVREALAIAVAMGGNTIRSTTLGVSFGNALSLEPSLNKLNPKAWDAIDYALYAAREYGLRVIIPLMDNYE